MTNLVIHIAVTLLIKTPGPIKFRSADQFTIMQWKKTTFQKCSSSWLKVDLEHFIVLHFTV